MKKLLLFIPLIILSLLTRAQAPDVPATSGVSFGERTTAEGALKVDELAAFIANKPSAPVKVEGRVVDVCQVMGCWLKMETATGTVMVKMKDESFFVPLALNGKRIVAQGVASLKETSVKMLRHYAADAGKSKSAIAAIKSPKKEVAIEATGILVL